MKILKLLPFLLLLLLAGCRSSKSVIEGSSTTKVTGEKVFIEKLVANAQREQCVTAKVDMKLNALDKEIAVNGRLRMKRDQVVQLSLTLLGFEVGRIEFTPQDVLIVDRVNKQYVRAAYGDVSFLRQANLDFYALQSLFWNELFVPGEQKVASQLSRFLYSESGDHVMLTLTDAPKLNYNFLTQLTPNIISQVAVQSKNAADLASLEWTYDRFTELDHRYFPTLMSCEVKGLDRNVGFVLNLSRLDNDDKWETQTKISSRYRERKVEEIFKYLLAM